MAASIMELPDNSSGINISDVIEVIETDCNSMDSTRREGPYIKIVEQPASKALRFRYECEGRSAGSIPGVNSSTENKTYPTIQIKNYKGKVVVVVSCVTKDAPYKPHPHNLVGREGCKRGVCTLEIHNDTMTQSFDHLGIQCVKKKDIEDALRIREEIRVDPFKTGFSHRTQAGSIDLNAVRLCFQAFLEDRPNSGTFTIPLVPVVSEIIYDKKALCDLAICRLSHSSATVAGGLEMILLCEKVLKEDIAVRLYEEKNGEIVWAANCEFTPAQVHKQVAITFKTPRYHTMQVDKPVQVFIQLQRPSDHETSEPLPFQLTPLDSGRPAFWSLRRYRADYRTFSHILSADTKLLTKVDNVDNLIPDTEEAQDTNNNSHPTKPQPSLTIVDQSSPKPMEVQPQPPYTEVDTVVDSCPIELNNEVKRFEDVASLVDNVEQSFDDLINEVDDFDEIMSSELNQEIPTVNDGIYSSFQMAMKNPFEFVDMNTSGYEDVLPPPPRPLEPKPLIRDQIFTEMQNDDILPPLPPKRIRKSPPNKNLPPVPEGKKLNIFQKLFSSKRKDKSRKNSVSSMGSRRSLVDDKSVVEPDEVTLTEAEHYALYTALAPHATASEFDEASFYYSPVEGLSQTVK
ncbi:embryonic polarity protein dorsal-like isoform X1 [Macrosteles quadrilineatus]|uniref:embryonic polarity protein dorsal-like isoform X1 n=2 Tax=Macrosteles quadrilineatus TaxID=74068 RepID=UPI0023E271C3|nr:embryonic polarity protein dorsal-like isoform X1 [Macrosteles quadrilineatus]